MDNLLAHMRRGLLWTAAQQWGVQGIRLAVLIVLARMVSSSEFGVFAFASTAVGVVHLFCNQGMTAAIVQLEKLESRHMGAAFASTLFAGFLLAVLLVAGAPLLGLLLKRQDVVPVVRMLAWVLPLYSISGLPIAIWRRELQFERVAVVNTSAQLIASIAAIALAINGFGIWSLCMRMMGEALILVLLTVREAPWGLLFSNSLQDYARGYRELARVGFPSAGVNLATLGRNRLDELLIGSTLGAEALGYYALARREIDGLSALVPVVIGNALQPVLSRVQQDSTHVRAVMMRGIGLLGAIALPAFAGFAAAAGTWVPLMLGPRWLPSIPILHGLAVVAMCRAIAGFSTGALFAIGHAGKRFMLELATSAVTLAITLIALPGGIGSVVWATAAGAVLLTPCELFWISRWVPISLPDQLRALLRAMISSGALIAIIVLVQIVPQHLMSPILRLMFSIASTGLILLYGFRRIPSLSEAKQAC